MSWVVQRGVKCASMAVCFHGSDPSRHRFLPRPQPERQTIISYIGIIIIIIIIIIIVNIVINVMMMMMMMIIIIIIIISVIIIIIIIIIIIFIDRYYSRCEALKIMAGAGAVAALVAVGLLAVR